MQEMECNMDRVLRDASFLSRLTALHWGTDNLPVRGPHVLDVAALAGQRARCGHARVRRHALMCAHLRRGARWMGGAGRCLHRMS